MTSQELASNLKGSQMLIEYTDNIEREELARKYPIHIVGHHVCGQCNDGWICTRDQDHEPPHVAHASAEHAYASWSEDVD